MNKKILLGIGVVVILAIGAGAAYWFMNMSHGGTPPTTTEPNTVIIQNFMYGPDPLIVQAGTTVTWINQDFIPHDVKSDTFSSPKLGKGEKFTFTFTTAGTYDYICSIHPTMVGKIIVQ